MPSTTYNITPGRFSRELPVTTQAHFKSSTASTNATLIRGSAGSVFNIIVHNTHAGGGSSITIRFYDKATAPVVGTDVPMIIFHVQSNDSKELNFTSGITFKNGIGSLSQLVTACWMLPLSMLMVFKSTSGTSND
jgi:hypothetical protein